MSTLSKKKLKAVTELRKFSEDGPDLKQNEEGQNLNLASHLQDLLWAMFALLFTALNFKAPAGCLDCVCFGADKFWSPVKPLEGIIFSSFILPV